jgi:hypothetical protein
MDPETQEQRAKWRETSAAGLVAGLLILLLIGFGIFAAISIAPIAEKIPSSKVLPDGTEGDVVTPEAKSLF